MYSAPLRLVHTFLHATLHVWHPRHLSRWKTEAIWDRTFMGDSPLQFRKFPHQNGRIAIAANRAPVVEVVRELRVATRHQVWLQSRPGQAVVAARPAASPQWRSRHADGPLGRMVLTADSTGNPRRDDGARHHDAVVVVGLDPVVVSDPERRRIVIV